MANHDAVPAAWRRGEYARGGALWTDGKSIWSYSHIIGRTDRQTGQKIGYDCHYSVTTARHSGGVQRASDVVEDCVICARGGHA